MQTFLPYMDFVKVGRTLDWQRLGKQRVEAQQILNTIGAPERSTWRFHPAVRMWQNHTELLKFYINTMIDNWLGRGYSNNMSKHRIDYSQFAMPTWLDDPRLFLSHQCNLMRKDPEYYGQFKWRNIDTNAPYWWPVKLKDEQKQTEMVAYWGG